MSKLNWITAALPKLMEVGPKLKGWIFADGKFNIERAGILLGSLVILLCASYFLPPESLEIVIELLDELSDIIGYS